VATSGSPSDGPNGDYALDAQTTDTPDWACIRQWESGDNYSIESGAYGFEPSTGDQYFGIYPVGGVPPAEQDAAALAIFAANGDHFRGAWKGSPEKCGLE
jgi:hypothetical protein